MPGSMAVKCSENLHALTTLKPCEGHPSGWTLIEACLSLAMASVMVSLSLAGLQRVQNQARSVMCRSHLGQWGQATALYCLDNQDWLPLDGAPNGRSLRQAWYVNLPLSLGIQSYHEQAWRTNRALSLPTSSIWICPSNPRRSNGINLFHYTLNRHVNGSGSGNQVKITTIPNPDQTIWLYDNAREAAVAGWNHVHTNLHGLGAHFGQLGGSVIHPHAKDYWDFELDRPRIMPRGMDWIPSLRE